MFDQGVKAVQWKKDSFFKQNNAGAIGHSQAHTHKSERRSKYHQFKRKAQNYNILRKRRNVWDTGLGKEFLISKYSP